MTSVLTVRLDEETARELAELAERYRSRSAAIQDAIHRTWRRLQADKLEAGYAAAVAENPYYPYESPSSRGWTSATACSFHRPTSPEAERRPAQTFEPETARAGLNHRCRSAGCFSWWLVILGAVSAGSPAPPLF